MKTNELITNYLALLFNNVDWPNIGDASGLQNAATVGNFYLSLHTADPGILGDQTTNEAAYTGYTRVAVARGASQWTVATPQISNVNAISWPACTAGTETETHWGIGTALSGAGHLLYSGVIGGQFNGFTAETTDSITIPGSAFSIDDRLAFYPLIADCAFPVGMTEGTVYFVKTASADVVTIAATSGGTTINITAAGSGLCSQAVPFAVATNVVPTISAGDLIILER